MPILLRLLKNVPLMLFLIGIIVAPCLIDTIKPKAKERYLGICDRLVTLK